MIATRLARTPNRFNRRLRLAGLLAVALPALANAGSVIFIHPDGAGVNSWGAARLLHKGPDSPLAWDTFERTAIYTGNMKDTLVSTSHGGATSHAYGVKVVADSFGMDGTEPIQSLSGFDGSIMDEAMAAGLRTGLVNSGHICEPGTAAFVAPSPSRQDQERIAADVIASGVNVILSGGEKFLLPEGVEGRHGPGRRTDGRDLIAEAREAGYTVVFTRDELLAIDPGAIDKLLGVFAWAHTFHDKPEEILAASGQPLYEPDAPTLKEMTMAAVDILNRDPGFLLVVEEEGSDNFGNANNAPGLLEALGRADDAIGYALTMARSIPDLQVITAADSDGGGAQVVCQALGQIPGFATDRALPGRMANAAPLDGRNGFLSRPFESAPDKAGNTFPFGIAWASFIDVAGGIAAKASGHHADRLPPLTDNTDIYRMMYLALFGKDLFEAGEE